jgi:phosphoenolpyruvate carboxylase
MHRDDIQFPAKDAALREDVHALGALVGDLLREQGGDELFNVVEGDRQAAIIRREGRRAGVHAPERGSVELVARVLNRPAAVAEDLARAFSTWFQVVNLVEKVHRVRRRRQYFLGAAAPQPHGVEDSLVALREQGFTLGQVLELLSNLRIEPVFTAHPAESTRRTLLRQQQRIARLLLARLDPTLTPQELRGVWGKIRSEITIGWQTGDHPRQRLTVADEREHALFYLAEIIYRIVPAFYEEIDAALEKVFAAQPGSVEIPAILDFGSWVGGDMDGNPDVHAKTIRETLARHHQLIVNAYFTDVQSLAATLSQSANRVAISGGLQKKIDEYNALLPGAQLITPARHDRMPYRVFLGQVAERLRNTYEGKPNHYDNAGQFAADIALVAHSLEANGGWNAGLHSVQRLQRRIGTFGFHLATLDVRQRADVHHDIIAEGLADERWRSRPVAERIARLRTALEKDKGPAQTLGAAGRRALWVFEAMAQCRHKYGRPAIGNFIVSGATDADDVLAVLLLARWAAVVDRKTGEVPFDVAPLFESPQALENCGACMRRLLAEPVYQKHLQARGRDQSVLIGYSDSNKESGIAASRWLAHRAQADLVQVAREANARMIVFHARGGSTSRGGGRIDALVQSAPPGAVTGKLRVTEEGELISQGYGLRPIAMRTLERAFYALALATSRQGGSEDARYLAALERFAAGSREAYRTLVHADPRFYEYFRHATPIDAIERMQIGSRGQARDTGLDQQRPVPWVFAWTQTRHMLPGWFGVGSGLEAVTRESAMDLLREMYRRWFFFTSLIDDVEAMLARADLDIARHYNALAPRDLQAFFEPVAAEFALTQRLVLEIKGCERLLDSDPTLQRSIQLRNPYVDPIHLMQVDLLRRWRAADRRDVELFDALLASILGIAQGVQSTG